MIGDGIGSLLSLALPFIKSVAPKVLGAIGLSSIGALTSNAINKTRVGAIKLLFPGCIW